MVLREKISFRPCNAKTLLAVFHFIRLQIRSDILQVRLYF